MEASRKELASALEERDELLSLVKDISTSMERIKSLENVMAMTGDKSGENPIQRKQIMAEIAAIRLTLKQRREKLSELETQLEKSSLFTDDLRETIIVLRRQIDSQAAEINNLQRQLSEANHRIMSLNNEVDSLSYTVDSVTEEREAAEATSLRLENELNTCYYIIATKAELKKHQIIETGFLRKSKLMKGDFDKGSFITADKRYLTTINLHCEKAKILTNHPADSYEIVDNDKQLKLHILDAAKFWSLSNYLVIESD